MLPRTGPLYRREDGIIIIDPEKAKGQEAIVNACPYRVIYWNAEKQVPQKCTLCAHRLDEGAKQPRCVESCPTGALVFGDLDDPDSEIAKLSANAEVEALHPEYKTQPLVKYIGLPKRFVAGEVVFKDNMGECAQGVTISLSGGGATLETKTDRYGDFEFEGLKKNAPYQINISADRLCRQAGRVCEPQRCESGRNCPGAQIKSGAGCRRTRPSALG